MTTNFAAFIIACPWVGVLIVLLAMYSITRLITEDTIADGPRNWFFDRFPHEGYTTDNRPKRGTFQVVSQGKYYVTKGTKLGKLVSCPWCSGFYVALAMSAALLVWPIATLFVLTPMALRVVPGIIHDLIG